MRLRLPALPALLLLLPVLASASAVPWRDGESADYNVRWGALPAAAARFTAHEDKDGGGWRFSLDLRTRGAVEAVHPIRSFVYSVARTGPWRSVAYGEDRLTHGAWRSEKGWIDYGADAGTWSAWKDGKETDKTFPVGGAAVQDIGSMLYGLRLQDWKEGAAVPWLVYDGPKVEKAEATLLRREPVEPSDGSPAVPCLVVRVVPLYDDPAEKARHYGVTLWITDDARRLPLRADLKARFGTFTLEWMKPGTFDTAKE